jgi:toxin ParE1/3/4
LSIQDIYDYIYLESPQNAEIVIDALFDLGDQLNLFPERNPIDPLFN